MKDCSGRLGAVLAIAPKHAIHESFLSTSDVSISCQVVPVVGLHQ